MDNYMVSNVDAEDEGWAHVDKLDNVCAPPDDNGIYFPGKPLPNLLHFCQRYQVGEFAFAKRRVDTNIFTCEHDLLIDIPDSISKPENFVDSGEVEVRKLFLNLIRF